MKYQHIIGFVSSAVWAILPEKWDELTSLLALKASGGGDFTAEEIQARIGTKDRRSVPPAGSVAVIPVHGVIAHRMSALEASSGGASAEAIGRLVGQVAADDSIGTIVYDFDSPGGTVTGVSELAAQMWALRGKKHQIAHVNGLAASAAYWLASQADEIVSLPSGRAGSIGVFTAHADISAALEKEGINVSVFSAGKYKTEGLPVAPLTDEAKAHIQASVDDAYQAFVADVARGRGVSVADVRGGFGQGRALQASQALEAGLIDRVETFDATVARVVGRSASRLRSEAEAADVVALERLERF